MIYSLCISLIVTNMVEVAIAVLCKVRDEDNISKLIGINCLTNPVVVFITNMCISLNNNVLTVIVVLVLELIVLFVEGYLFKKFLKNIKINPYVLSLCLNSTSFIFGLLLEVIVGK